jgi:hypothetical protein
MPMNKKERVRAALTGKAVDRLPFPGGPYLTSNKFLSHPSTVRQ